MNEDPKEILPNLNKDIEQEKLLQYLNDHLSDAERHDLEKQMSEDDFMNDAVEGLQAIENKNKIAELVQQMNTDLKKQLEKKKKRKAKRKIPAQSWAYYTIVLLLLLVIIAWLVIKKTA